MSTEPPLPPPANPTDFCVDSSLGMDEVTQRIEGLKSRGLLRGFAPLVRTEVWPGGFRVSADVGRNLWIHIEGEIAPTPTGTRVTGQVSRGLGWRIYGVAAGISAVFGTVGLVWSIPGAAQEVVLSWLAFAVVIPGITVTAYLRIRKVQRALVRKVAAAIEGTLATAADG